MSREQAQPTFLLGTAVKITTTLNIDTVTSAKITIYDSSLVKKVEEADMTKSADKVYTYIYQSDVDDINGLYVASMSLINGGYTTVEEEEFEFTKQVGT